jgi:hypothetical protein
MHSFLAKPRQGRQKLAHGLSRGKSINAGEAPSGAEEMPFFRPLRGCSGSTLFPRLAPWARIYRPSGA